MDKPVTIVTGTRKGIGRFLANHYADQGHQVIGCSRKEPDWRHENYTHMAADVTSENDVCDMFAAIRKQHGRADNLINNAGIASMNHSLLTPIPTLEKILDTNVVGTFLFCREATKLMKKRRYGRIVNFTTVAVPLKLEGEAAYVASKAAVQSLTQVLAREYGGLGITVNAIGPVPVETDLIRAVPKEKIDELIARQAIPRYGTYEDIANVTDFYLQDASDFITGQVMFLGGIS